MLILVAVGAFTAGCLAGAICMGVMQAKRELRFENYAKVMEQAFEEKNQSV